MKARIYEHQSEQTRDVVFTAHLVAQDNCIRLEEVQYPEGEALSEELTRSLLEKANELGNISNFELDGMDLHL